MTCSVEEFKRLHAELLKAHHADAIGIAQTLQYLVDNLPPGAATKKHLANIRELVLSKLRERNLTTEHVLAAEKGIERMAATLKYLNAIPN